VSSWRDLAAASLRLLDPEDAHGLTMTALALGLGPADRARPDPVLAVSLAGLQLANPIGLGAGFDKDAKAPKALLRAGFGFVECGTTTPRPQSGNPRPRLFRLPADRAVINRMGFNNGGLEVFAAGLSAPRGLGIVGANVGANKDSPDRARDYVLGLRRLWTLADYFTLNISSPNTPGLRDLQGEARLRAILQAIITQVPVRPPLLIKLAPDLSADGLKAVVDTAVACGAEGLIISNTTISRPAGFGGLNALQVGGLSGPPLFDRSTEMLRLARQLAQGRLVLVGCGGIRTGADVLTKIRAGASLVQLYTEFAYAGPSLIHRLKSELLVAMKEHGFEGIADAVGTQA